MNKAKNAFDAKNIVDGVLNYYLYAPIGINPDTGEGISGQRFADDFNFIENAMKGDVRQINVRINSTGGSIVHGLSMIGAIRNITIPVDTYVDGIAGSMAGVLAMAGKKRFMNDFARFMVHDPQLGDGQNLTDQEKELIKQFKDVLVTIFNNNTKYTKEQIDAIMTAETWFNAQQAKDAGLIDSIVKTERNVGLLANDSKTVYSFANDLLIRSQNENDMKKIFKKLSDLKLTNGITETDNEKIESLVVDTIENLTNENSRLKGIETDLTNKVKEKEDEIATLNAGVQKQNDDAAVAAVDNAINEGKITKENREKMLTVAKNNIDTFKDIVASVPKKSVSVLQAIKNAGKDVVVDDAGKYEGKTLRQLEKENPKLVEKIKNDRPDLFAKLYKGQYGVDLPESK